MKTKIIGRTFALPVLALALVFTLTACGGKDEKKPASQVAAKVNAEEISIHQINYFLGRSGAAAISPEQVPKVRSDLLEKLIDQQLAVEQAIEKKLDRSPEVVMAIEAARREILARAYLEQLSGGLSKPSVTDAKAYYAEHPQLFSERRVYSIQEIVAPTAAGEAGPLREMLAAGKPMEEIAAWLKSKEIKFSGSSAMRPAEQIPLELLLKLSVLKDGQGLVLENGAGVTVMRVVASQLSPVDEAMALPRIQQFLGNQRAAQAAEGDLKALRAKAKISYMGEFAAGASKVAPAAPATEQKPAANSAIETGVAGLK